MKKIKLSICIPSYNRPELLEKALTSVINQTIKPFEVVIVDDCSTEDMSKIKKLCKKVGFKYLVNKRNIGLMNNFNAVLKQATGDYVTLLHNDDFLSKYYVEKMTKVINKYPNYNIYATNGIAVTEDHKVVGEYRIFLKDKSIESRGDLVDLWKRDFPNFCSVIGCTVYKTKFIHRNLFNTEWGNEADLENSLRFLSEEKIMYVDLPLYFDVSHTDMISFKLKKSKHSLNSYIHNRLAIYKQFKDSFTFLPFYLEKMKTMHFLQLFVKYRYPFKEVCAILEISSIGDFIKIIYLIPFFVLNIVVKRFLLSANKPHIERFLK